MLYSLDTNAVIALMSGEPAGVRERIGSLTPEDAGISTIVLQKLLWGAYKSEQVERNLKRIALLRMTEIVFDTGRCARRSGDPRRFEAQGNADRAL